MLITTTDWKKYRTLLGFTSQATTEDFLSAKDIVPKVDFSYTALLNQRLTDIVGRINSVVYSKLRLEDTQEFNAAYIERVYTLIKENGILPKLNNQGRRPEQVYFSWMRGFVASNFFLRALALIFAVKPTDIELIGDDDFTSIESFKRTPKADWEIRLPHKKKIRVEMQSGFTGINDIKQHKVIEARKIFDEKSIPSLAVHLDLFNGQAAFLKLNEIQDNDVHWITRQQMEGQTVFNIDQSYFVWKLTEPPPKYTEIDFS